jgi:outer membrane lipase/esterase
MRGPLSLCCLLLGAIAQPAAAQQLDGFVAFGDSSIDTGWYKTQPTRVPDTASGLGAKERAAIDAAGHGARFVDGNGLMSPEVLAAYFDLVGAASVANGGSNYATGGARSDLKNVNGGGLFSGALSLTVQVNNYLASNGGVADRNALYLISIGGNDVSYALNQGRTDTTGPNGVPIFDITTVGGRNDGRNFVIAQGQAAATDIARLQQAGARYIVVANLPESFPGGNGIGAQTSRDFRSAYNAALWGGLIADGVNFVPADVNAVRVAIRDDFASGNKLFGFASINNGTAADVACADPGGTNAFSGGAFALVCSPDKVKPNASQFLFSDLEGHLTSAGQKIIADYEYSLLLAPSQISLLAETAVKARLGLVSNIQSQIEATKQQPAGGSGINLWATGDVSRLQTDNAPGFAESSGTPAGLTAGLSMRSGGLIVGAAFSSGHLRAEFGDHRGHYDQDELAASAYASLVSGPFWGTVVGTWGALDYGVTRVVPVGITIQSNVGSTDGTNASLALQTGFDFKTALLKHGPVAGITLQRANVHGFSETSTMGFTDLTFDGQTRDSAITALGWRASVELGAFRPFAQLTWNHELAGDRDVTVSLNSLRAASVSPSYHLPAAGLGTDWGTATLGSFLVLGNGVTGLASFSVDAGQHDSFSYGAQLGINVAF